MNFNIQYASRERCFSVFSAVFFDFFAHQKTLNTSHAENIEASVKQNGLKPAPKHTDSEYIGFDIGILATSRVIRTQPDRICYLYSRK